MPPTPNDMPALRVPQKLPSSTRHRITTLLNNVLDHVDAEGAFPDGKPNRAFEFLPELISAAAAFSTMTMANWEFSRRVNPQTDTNTGDRA